MRLVAEVFPRIVVMDDGRIVADGPTDVVLGDDRLLEAPCPRATLMELSHQPIG
jgi:ABC-type branched-subunit amino acid transport system ATPase component